MQERTQADKHKHGALTFPEYKTTVNWALKWTAVFNKQYHINRASVN